MHTMKSKENLPSSCRSISNMNERLDATLSPQLILSTAVSSNLTEQPPTKSNPISPADDNLEYVSDKKSIHDNHEEALDELNSNVPNIRENFNARCNEKTAAEGSESNYILDGQEVETKLILKGPGNWFARRVPKLLSLGRNGASKSIPTPSTYSQWMSPPRNFHPTKRIWKSPPTYLETAPVPGGDADGSRGAIGYPSSENGNNINTMYGYKPSPPPRKRLSQKNTPSPFRSRSVPSFLEHTLNGEVLTPPIAFSIYEAGMVPDGDSSIAMGSFSPMGFHSESQQGSFSNCTPNRFFVTQQGSLRNPNEERTQINVKPPKNRSPFSRFISEMTPLQRNDSELNDGENDLFEIEPVTRLNARQSFQRLHHPAQAMMSPRASSASLPNQESNANLNFNSKAYSPMPNLNKIRSFHRNACSSSGTTIVKLGQNMNSMETRRCFEGINNSMQRESRSRVVEDNHNPNAENTRKFMVKQELRTLTSSNGPQVNPVVASLPPFPPTSRTLQQAPRTSPPSPPSSARQRNHPSHDFFYGMGATSTYHAPSSSSVPVATANIHEGYLSSYTTHIPQIAQQFYQTPSGPYMNVYTPGKKPQSGYNPPQTPAPRAHVSNSGDTNENKENAVSTSDPPSGNKNNPCNCKKSKCLKLYCECFAAEKFCFGCNCNDCWNNLEHEEFRNEQIRLTKLKNPQAFAPRVHVDQSGGNKAKHNMGCKCKKSACLKKYCECFEAGANCGEKCKCTDCMNFPGSQALIDRRRKIKDAKGAKIAMDDGDELWRVKTVPESGSSAGTDERPAPPRRVQRESPFDYPLEYPLPYKYPEDANREFHIASKAHHASQGLIPSPNSPMHRQCYPTPHHCIPQGPPFISDHYSQHDSSYAVPSQSYPSMNMAPSMIYQHHLSSIGQNNNNAERRYPVPIPFPPHYNGHHHMPYYGYRVAPTPMNKTLPVNSSTEHHRKNETPQLSSPSTVVATRLNFDPSKSRKARQAKPGDQELTSSTFGKGVPEQPKTASLTIFSFLSNADLYNASLVSKEWSKLAVDRELWKFYYT